MMEILGIPYDDEAAGVMGDGIAHPDGFSDTHAVQYASRLKSEDARMFYRAEESCQSRQRVLAACRGEARKSHLWDGSATDEFGHRVPSYDEIGESHPDEALEAQDASQRAIDEQMDERLIQFHQR